MVVWEDEEEEQEEVEGEGPAGSRVVVAETGRTAMSEATWRRAQGTAAWQGPLGGGGWLVIQINKILSHQPISSHGSMDPLISND